MDINIFRIHLAAREDVRGAGQEEVLADGVGSGVLSLQVRQSISTRVFLVQSSCLFFKFQFD